MAGNGLLTRRGFDPYTGRLLGQSTGLLLNDPIREQHYEYDAQDNVTRRQDVVLGIDEQFTYDSFDRLTGVDVTADDPELAGIVSYGYDIHGNMLHKSDTGDMSYDGANRLTQLTRNGGAVATYSYDANGNLLAGDGRTLEWTSFNMPRRIENDHAVLAYAYGPDRERVKLDTNDDGKITTTWYAGGGFEQEQSTEEGLEVIRSKHTIFADGEAVAIQIRTVRDGTEEPDQTRYLHRDALGNVDTITDGHGEVVMRASLDPFGKRRATVIVQADLPEWSAKALTRRGFTGHEELQEVGLIHMNGRIYDPDVARFLSADPHVGNPGSSQGFNRYSYVQNNPLKYTDPSGFFLKKLFKKIGHAVKKVLSNRIVQAVITIAVAIFAGPLAAALVNASFVKMNGGSWADVFKSAAITVATCYAFHLAGDIYTNTISNTLAHGVIGGVRSVAMGGSFKSGFLSGTFGAIATPAATNGFDIGGFVQATVAGGIGSVLGGGKFENGAVTGAFGYLFNAAVHGSTRAQWRERANAAIKRIDDYISAHPGKAVPISAEDMEAIMISEVLTLEYVQELSGSYKDLTYSEFLYKLRWAGDSMFINYHGTKFDIAEPFPMHGTHLAEDINYYYQGFVTAAAGRSQFMRRVYILGYNLKQAITRPSFHDLRQIHPAQRWASEGQAFYESTIANMKE